MTHSFYCFSKMVDTQKKKHERNLRTTDWDGYCADNLTLKSKPNVSLYLQVWSTVLDIQLSNNNKSSKLKVHLSWDVTKQGQDGERGNNQGMWV